MSSAVIGLNNNQVANRQAKSSAHSAEVESGQSEYASSDGAARALSHTGTNKSVTEQLAHSPTTTNKLASEPTTAERLAGIVSDDIKLGGALLENDIIGATIGRAVFEYTAPHASRELKSLSGKAGMGIAADATLMEVVQTVEIGHIAKIDARTTGATVNAHATAGASGQLKGLASEFDIKLSTGAEAMLIDARAGIELSITPKSIVDAYNDYIDPIVDWAASTDVPGLPDLPDTFDHGLVLGGHVEGGIGAAAKAGVGAELGNGRGTRVKANFKVGLWKVFGMGAFFGVK